MSRNSTLSAYSRLYRHENVKCAPFFEHPLAEEYSRQLINILFVDGCYMLSGTKLYTRLAKNTSLIIRTAFVSVVILQTACVDEGNSSASSGTVTSAFSGSVGDGPIVGATVNIYDRNGQLVHTTVSDQSAKYSAEITTSGSAFPLTVEVKDGIDLVTGREPDFTMTSVVEDPNEKNININPYSTLITETARLMKDGLTSGNIASAKITVVKNMNFGLDEALVTDPITTKVTQNNVAVITKSSEALGEMIRRVRKNLDGTGVAQNENDVVAAFASDLSDGVLDGIGVEVDTADRVSTASFSGNIRRYIRLKRIAAMSKVTSAQVLIESFSNNLKVDGGNARKALDASIVSTNPGIAVEKLTSGVKNNRAALEQVKSSVDAARNLTPSIELTELSKKLEKVTPESTPVNVEDVLPPNSGAELDEVIAAVTVATDDQLNLVNVSNDKEVSAETERPETERPETERPETERPETERPETERPETERPETERTETERTETERTETERTETERTETERTETERTETERTETDRTETDRTETDRTETDRTETDRTETDRTETDKPTGLKPTD